MLINNSGSAVRLTWHNSGHRVTSAYRPSLLYWAAGTYFIFPTILEKSILYPNQALPPPVYTNISKLQAAAQRGVGGASKDSAISDTPRAETPPLPSHYDNHSGESLLHPEKW